MPNYSSAEKVLEVIRSGDDVELIRAANRLKVTEFANCFPPLDEEEAESSGIKINVNFGDLMVLLKQAYRQMISAFRSNQNFFMVKLPDAPDEMQADWEAFITKTINRPIRKSLKFFELQRSTLTSVVTHGVGPRVWDTPHAWCPRFLAMADLRIPTDTTTDFEDLDEFAVRVYYTVSQLVKLVFNGKPNNKWNKKQVWEILKNYKELNTVCAANNYDVETNVERLVEIVKQNGSYWNSDAIPRIPLWHFFFKDFTEGTKQGWFLRIVPESGAVRSQAGEQDFLYEDERPFAGNLKEILACQFGDLSNDTPFKYHSIRGLGFILLEPCFYDNLTICRMLQHVHDNFNIWLRSSDPAGKARAQVQEFSNLGVVAPGISVVPINERHQVDSGNVEMVMGRMGQLKSQASSSYTQNTDTGTKKEQTAFETRVKLEQVSSMMSGILGAAFIYEGFMHDEISRRFCIKDSSDPDVIEFQKKCKQHGIPEEWLDVDRWEVEPVTPLGMGNPSIAQAAAQQLFSSRASYSPKAQAEILHDYTLVITGDPRKAERLAPMEGKPGLNEGGKFGISIFGTLMQGAPIPIPDGISPIEQFEAMLPLFAGKIAQMEKRDNMADYGEGAGLQTVGQYLGQLIQRVGQDPALKQQAKQYGDALGRLMNLAKGLIQRGVQAQQKQQQDAGDGGKAQAEIQTKAAKAKADIQIKQAKNADSMKQKNIAFIAEQRRKDADTHAQIQRDDAVTASKLKSMRHDEE